MKIALRLMLGLIISLIIAMWVYALFFASKQSINKFDDRDWASRAQARCLVARQERDLLADYRIVGQLGDTALIQRADLIDQATDTIESFIVEFRAAPPIDPKGIELVGLWLDDYQTYVNDRRAFAQDLRIGINRQFAETPVDGLPLSEKLATFAADNEMSNCKPPIDLSV